MQVTATDADDPTYGNSARLVYSILQGQPYFSVEPQTGTQPLCPALFHIHPGSITLYTVEVGSLHTLRLESLKLVFQPLHKCLVN